MVRIPKTFAEILGFSTGTDIEMFCDGETLTIKAKSELETLASVLAASSPDAFRFTQEDKEWLNMPSVGSEA